MFKKQVGNVELLRSSYLCGGIFLPRATLVPRLQEVINIKVLRTFAYGRFMTVSHLSYSCRTAWMIQPFLKIRSWAKYVDY